MPTTVPGSAKGSIVTNSNAPFPANCCRPSRYAIKSPNAAVSGADTTATVSDVKNELHAPPVQSTLPLTTSTPNAVT